MNLKRIIKLSALLFFIVITSFGSMKAMQKSPWPMFGQNPQHNGRSAYQGPATPTLRWEFQTGGPVRSSPVIGSDGTIYISSGDGAVYALDGSTGAELWHFQVGGYSPTSPSIGRDGNIYVGSGTPGPGVIALKGTTGTVLWEFGSGGWGFYSPPTIGSDGTVYVGDYVGGVYALDGSTGAMLWEFPVEAGYRVTSPALGSDGTVYVTSGDGKTFALNGSTGAELWQVYHQGLPGASSPVIGSDGTVYVRCQPDWNIYPLNLYALSGTTGAKIWEFQTGGMDYSSPAIGGNGTVYLGSDRGILYALNGLTGKKLWEFQAGSIVSSPAIGSDGTVYFGSQDGYVYALNGSTGTKLWDFSVGSPIRSSPAIGSDGTLYLGSDDGKVHAIAPKLPQWTRLGPDGGRILTLAIDPSNPQIVYAGAASESAKFTEDENQVTVFKSSDGGTSWSVIKSAVNVLAIDPANSQILYVGTMGGVEKSTDGGASWNPASNGLLHSAFDSGSWVFNLAIDPTNPQTLYATVDSLDLYGFPGVYKSTDGGTSWGKTTLPVHTNSDHFSALIIDPKSSRTLYTAHSDGLFKSTDGGDNWTSLVAGPPNFQILMIDPMKPETLYGVATGVNVGQVQKSTDGGNTWKVTGFPETLRAVALEVDATNSEIIYAGTTSGGVFMSTDGAGTWNPANTGLTSNQVLAVAVDVRNPQTIFAGTQIGIFKSTNQGGAWIECDIGITGHRILSTAVDPRDPRTLYAGTWSGGLFKSTDSGVTWVDTGLPGTRDVFALAIDPQNPQTLYAATGGSYSGYGSAHNTLIPVWPGGAVYKSTDGGSHWETAINYGCSWGWSYNRSFYSLAIDPVNPSVIYAGNTSGVHKSTDGSATWSTNLPGSVKAFAINPINSQTLYAGNDSGIYKSTDGGAAWSSPGLAGSSITAITLDASYPDILYVATSNMGIFKSTDGGATFAAVNTGLTNTDVHGLVVDPTAPQTLYAGTQDGRVFKSTDEGSNWADTGLATPFATNALSNAPAYYPMSSHRLYAGTDGQGLWAYGAPAKSSLGLTLNPGGAATAVTMEDIGPTQSGYAELTENAGVAPYGIAVYSYRPDGVVVSECGIPPSPPTTSARIFVNWRTGEAIPGSSGKVTIDTGLALVNRGAGTATITFTLCRIDGQVIAQGWGTLARAEHVAKYLWQLPDIAPGFSLPPSFSTDTHFGTLEINSSQPLSVLALHLTTNQRGEMLMTSTPAADLNGPTPNSNPIYFPQLADGGGYTTSIMLLNTSNAVETGTMHIYEDDGSALEVQQVGGSRGSAFGYSIPPTGAYVFQTDAAPVNVNVGWVEVIPDGGTRAPVGSGIYQSSHNGVLVAESGIAASEPTTHARIFVDKSSGHDSSVAIANPGTVPLNITWTAMKEDGSTPAGTTSVPLNLNGKGHIARFIGERISGLPPAFRGVLDITGNTPFVPLTVRSLVNVRGDFLFTAFPVADMNASAPSPILFPQMASGGGYTTEFFVLSAGPANSATLNLFGPTGSALAVAK